MKAFLIDPFDKRVTEVDWAGGLQNIYDHTQCTCVTGVYPDRQGECIFMDDNGLTGNLHEQAFFELDMFDQPFAGRALWTGPEVDEKPADSQYTLDEIVSKVKFIGGINELRRHMAL